MIHLDLTDKEAEILGEFLATTLSNLSYEIADTDLMDYREALKKRRDVLVKVQESLGLQ